MDLTALTIIRASRDQRRDQRQTSASSLGVSAPTERVYRVHG